MTAVLGPVAVPTITLLVAALVFLVIEVFTPGFGFPGMLGLLLLASACFVQFMFGSPSAAMWILAISLAVLAVCLIFVFRSLSKGRLSRSFLVLNDTVSAAGGNDETKEKALVGQAGITETLLRPAGIAVIDGKRVDVVSEGAFIEPKTPVTVTAVEGTRVIVRRTEA